MPDMLVRLDDLPQTADLYEQLAAQNITLHRVMSPNYGKAFDFIKAAFGDGWAYEACSAISHQPSGLFVALEKTDAGKRIVGFSAYNATALDFFGPTGVDSQLRGKGLGAALLMSCLHDMKTLGYAYAIIGGAGPVHYYEKVCGATPIEGSWPGIYKDMLRPKKR